jgi:Immunity protein Imm5
MCQVTDLPNEVQALAAAALAEMQADRQHHMPPKRRQALYAALASAPDPALRAAPFWLAVLAAQRVLPLFQAQCPDGELPPALLAAAIEFLEGRLDPATAAEMEEQGYRASENAWGYEQDELPWPVGLAADAAYHALKEARGHQPLTNLEAFLRQGTVVLDPSEEQPSTPAPHLRARPAGASGTPAPGEHELNDEALCQLDNRDTASIAAVAAASTEFGPTCDPERLNVFWSWWLREALPAAVDAARRGQAA